MYLSKGVCNTKSDKPLVRAGEWTLASVVHHVQLQSSSFSIRRRAASVGAGKPWRGRGVHRRDMALENPSSCKRCSTVATDEWPLAQMNFVHVLLQINILLEELPTGDALERLLLEVDCLVVALHVVLVAEDFATGRVGARKLHTKMHFAVVPQHVTLGRKQLDTGRIDAWNLATHRRLLVANIVRCTWLLPATALEVGIEEMLLREGSFAGRAWDCSSLVVLRPGVGVEGAWVDAQLCCVLWAIVNEDLSVAQDVLDSPAMIMDYHTVHASN